MNSQAVLERSPAGLIGVMLTALLASSGCGSLAPSTRTRTTDGDEPDGDGTGSNASECTTDGAGTSTAGSTNSTGSTTSTGSTFATTAEPILKQQCYSCHVTQSPVFADEAAATAQRSAIGASVKAGRMPPSGPLAAADAAVIETWSQGAALMLAETTPTYEGTVKAIIDTKCAWCHSATAAPQDRERPYLTTYEQVLAEAKDVWEKMDEGEMPPRDATPALASGDTATIAAWRAAGSPRGVPPPPIDTTAGVYYVDAIKGLLSRACTGCHTAGVQAPDLASYDAAVNSAAAANAAIANGSMPPSGPLTASDKEAFAAWLEASTPYDAEGTTPPPAAAAGEGAGAGAGAGAGGGGGEGGTGGQGANEGGTGAGTTSGGQGC
jgi:hypothetical protein